MEVQILLGAPTSYMTLPNYPLEDEIKTISYYEYFYYFIIIAVVFFTGFDYFLFPDVKQLQGINILRLILLVLLHPKFAQKVKSSEGENITLQFSRALLIGLPFNLFYVWKRLNNIEAADAAGFYNYLTLEYGLILILIGFFLRMRFQHAMLSTATFAVIYLGFLFVIMRNFMLNNLLFNLFLFVLIYFGIILLLVAAASKALETYTTNQGILIDVKKYWYAYADNLDKNIIPITHNLRNIGVLYFDIAGLTDHLQEKKNLKTSEDVLTKLFAEEAAFCAKYGINVYQENQKYWRIIEENPAATNPEYLFPLAELSLFLQKAFKRICAENRVSFDLRMGMSCGKYVDYHADNQKVDIFFVNKAFEDSRVLEKHGVNGEIQVSQDVYNLLKDRFNLIKRGSLPLSKLRADDISELYLLQGVS